MARTSEPDIQFDPRHRIVGAIILVTLAVIVLPLLLDERASIRPEGNAVVEAAGVVVGDDNVNQPSKLVIRELSGAKTTAPVSEPSSKTRPNQTRVVVKRLDGTPKASATQTPKKSAPAPRPDVPATVATDSAATRPHWAVQVGTFSNPGNVRRLSSQLKEYGYSLMLKDVNLKQGAAVRVRVGPYSSRASADRAQGKIKQLTGVKGVVVAGP
jgi:DedD protein